MTRIYLLLCVLLCGSSACDLEIVCAQPGRDKDPLSWDRNVRALYSRYCYSCHGNSEPSGNVNLAVDTDLRLIRQNFRKWTVALEMVRSGQMPPEDAKQPSDEFRMLMVDFLEQTLAEMDCETAADPGKPVLRRLNRTEYDNAVLDLTGLDLQLGNSFPPDPTSYGFDNIGEALALTPAQIDMFHTAAKTIVDKLVTSDLQSLVWGRSLLDESKLAPREQARQLLAEFATRAFRHPVDTYYINRLLRLYDKGLGEGQSHLESLGHGLTAILISPRFLMRVERDRPEIESAYPVSDYELATRLSFFLWSRPPDQTLLDLAAANRLHETDVLREQTQRMLRDDKSVALVDNFFFQWFDLRNLSSHKPDKQVFPEFHPSLRQAMSDEVRLLLAEIVRADLSVMNLIDSDFTYLNARLAEHYGIPGLHTEMLQRVVLTGSQRGGLLTSAAFLMLQADPGRTNIPRRGNFIAAQILGDAPPPPPPNVPALDASDDGVKRSLRETFELHRSSPDCKGCHQKIDPLGFSLENYDAIGKWRSHDAGFPVDASAEMPDAQAFSGPEGLKAYLLSRREDFLHTFSTKLLIYALGRGLHASDECVVSNMMKAAEESNEKFSAFVLEIVTSVAFTHRRNAD